LYTGEENIPYAFEQGKCCTVLKVGSPTNQSLQLVYVTSFTNYEPPLTQLSRPAVLFIHSLSLLL